MRKLKAFKRDNSVSKGYFAVRNEDLDAFKPIIKHVYDSHETAYQQVACVLDSCL